MFRCAITNLVLFGFIVSQLAAVPHAHGATSPDNQHRHDAFPHIHIGFGGHSQARKNTTQRPPGLGEPRTGNEHDNDAIYLPGAGAPALGNDRSQNLHHCGLVSAAPLAMCSIGPASADASLTLPWRPPDDDPPDCPLFLTLRTIRI